MPVSIQPVSALSSIQPQQIQAVNHEEQVTNITSLSAPAVPEHHIAWPLIVTGFYLLGVAICLLRLVLVGIHTRQVLKSAVPTVSRTEVEAANILQKSLRLSRAPKISRSKMVDSPVYLSGNILLPSESNDSETELRMILAHEMAHAKRRDLVWEWLGTTVQLLFFFHPLVVLARREERLARETAADSLALAATQALPADYGDMLLALALRRADQSSQLIGAVGVIEGGSPLQRRLLALHDAGLKPKQRRQQRNAAAAFATLLILAFVPWKITHASAQPLSNTSVKAAPSDTPEDPNAPKMPVGNKTITGLITDSEHKPLANLEIGLSLERDRILNNGKVIFDGIRGFSVVHTDTQGQFTFPNLPAGNYYYGVGIQLFNNHYVPAMGKITLVKSDTKKYITVIMHRGVLITGRVIDGRSGLPLSRVEVEGGYVPTGGNSAAWESWSPKYFIGSDQNGAYQMRLLPGNIYVRIGMSSDSTLLSQRIAPAVQTALASPSSHQIVMPDIKVSLSPAITFLDPTGKPIANTKVSIRPLNMGKSPYYNNDKTNQAGSIIFKTTVGDSSSKSGIFDIGYGGNFASGTLHWSPGGPLIITQNGKTTSYPSGAATIQLQNNSAAVLTGIVTDSEGNPIPSATITMFTNYPNSLYGLGEENFESDSSGKFKVLADPSVNYQFYIHANGYNQIAVAGKSKSSESGQDMSYPAGSTTDLGVFHLLRASGSVSGRVVNSNGQPMPNIVAYVMGGKTSISGAMTDANGEFHIPNVVVGEKLTLNLCLHGEVPNSSQIELQSNSEMKIPNVMAGANLRKIVWDTTKT